mgnify:CR=1 FL=1|tara:strand:- start:151 stop:840 length:690 start_codon:yes stop_codon:yes gene_type:complete
MQATGTGEIMGLERIQRRFNELSELSVRVDETARVYKGEYSSGMEVVDSVLLIEWSTSVISLLTGVFGPSHPTTKRFSEMPPSYYADAKSGFDNLNAIFKSAKSDYEGGYLFDVANLVHSDVFTDELEQAKHFLDKNYRVAAAVIAGTVLESTLRRMCTVHTSLESENINAMNTELYKNEIYGRAVQKQVASWGDIRNAAAHGRPDEFDNAQVSRMIDGIRDFVAKHMR